MTPRERYPPDDPREWMNRARSNLTLARSAVAGVDLEDLCFEAQQAAEKSIKAVLIDRGIEFPFIHDLLRLLRLLEEAGEQVPQEIREADRLTRFATVSRYPGADPIPKSVYEDAVALAETVVNWASGLTKRSGADPN
jgi:HEPN domain-containing protein